MPRHKKNAEQTRSLVHMSANPDRCPVQSTLQIIAGRWKPLIMFHLSQSALRFGELSARIPEISSRMLARQLRDLEASNLVTRTVYAEVPPHTEYELTKLGMELDDVFASIAAWGMRYLAAHGTEPGRPAALPAIVTDHTDPTDPTDPAESASLGAQQRARSRSVSAGTVQE